MNIIYYIVGLLLLTFFAFSDIAFPIRLVGFIIIYTAISGIEIGVAKKYGYAQGREESILLSARPEDLKPGNYFFSAPATQRRDNSFVGSYRLYYLWIEHSEGMVPVEIIKSDRDKIEEAIGKPVDQIRGGEKFKIGENHEIIRI